jgi:hypothetical protein
MEVAQLVCFVRFEAFPFVPPEQKRHVIRRLFEMDVGHPEFQKFLQPLLQLNQYIQFYKTLKYWKKTGEFRKPLHLSLDIELVETLFWQEENAEIAQRLLAALLGSQKSHISLWNSAVNLWMSASSMEDKKHVLAFMDTVLFG